MEKEVSVKVIGYGDLTDSDKVVTAALGRFYEKDGKSYVFYELPDENNPKVIVKHKLLLGANSLELTKTSQGIKSEVKYIPGKTTSSKYATPYGILDLDFKTKKLGIENNEETLIIELSYDIMMGADVLSSNNLRIELTEV